MSRIVVGLSGGVDSSVAAYLLKEQGHEVIGMFMKNWHDTEATISDDCPWEEDSKDALLVAEKLGIPFQTIDLSEEYRERIVDYMFAEYEAGRTPNPDVLCNREIKFDVFLKAAEALGADYVATGHYCRKAKTNDGHFQLLAGKDPKKDQSYFLCQIDQQQLSKALFPIGELLKSEVREIATEQNLVTAGKKDSQGLCFVGKIKLPDFLQQQLKPQAGKVVEIDPNWAGYTGLENRTGEIHYSAEDGEIIGDHKGAWYYTIGQRKGLGIGGKEEPMFVIGTNTEQNAVYLGMGENHPGLLRRSLRIDLQDIHWVRNDLALSLDEEMAVLCRIRYRQPLQKATLKMKDNGLFVSFEEPQRAIAAGQFAAWYLQDELIGSGVIAS